MERTQVKVIDEYQHQQIPTGSIGYIDGYVRGGNGAPYAVVVWLDTIDLVPTTALRVQIPGQSDVQGGQGTEITVRMYKNKTRPLVEPGNRIAAKPIKEPFFAQAEVIKNEFTHTTVRIIEAIEGVAKAGEVLTLPNKDCYL